MNLKKELKQTLSVFIIFTVVYLGWPLVTGQPINWGNFTLILAAMVVAGGVKLWLQYREHRSKHQQRYTDQEIHDFFQRKR